MSGADVALIAPVSERCASSNAGLWAGRPILAYAVNNRVGEAPCWHPQQQCLYWIDVRGQQLLRLDPERERLTRWQLPQIVGALALRADNEVCLALVRELVMFNVETGLMRGFVTIDAEPDGNRLNDGKVSPSGRWFVFGSMDDRAQKQATGALYCSDLSGHVRRIQYGLTVANGIAWNVSGDQLYFSDSSDGVVYRASWDEVNGTIGPVETFARLDEAQGRPDGGTVDSADRYWSAGVSAGCINVLSAQGALVEKIALPCRAPTMCTFGGSGGADLYVTSLIRPQWNAPGEHDGALLRIQNAGSGASARLFG
jgi:sugar lactone lactonase YvrE